MKNIFANENDNFIIFYFWQITCPRQPSKLCRPCSSSWQFSPQCFLEAKYGQVFSHVFTTSIFLKYTKFHKILTWIVDFTWFSPVFARRKPNLKIVRAVDQKKKAKKITVTLNRDSEGWLVFGRGLRQDIPIFC